MMDGVPAKLRAALAVAPWVAKRYGSRHSIVRRCCSSVVEHPLGKGEVVSSILTGSTRKQPIRCGIFICAGGGGTVSNNPERCRNLQLWGSFLQAETPFAFAAVLHLTMAESELSIANDGR